MKKENRYKIQCAVDREAMIVALASAGYKVWIEEEAGDWSWVTNYYVCVKPLTTK